MGECMHYHSFEQHSHWHGRRRQPRAEAQKVECNLPHGHDEEATQVRDKNPAETVLEEVEMSTRSVRLEQIVVGTRSVQFEEVEMGKC